MLTTSVDLKIYFKSSVDVGASLLLSVDLVLIYVVRRRCFFRLLDDIDAADDRSRRRCCRSSEDGDEIALRP